MHSYKLLLLVGVGCSWRPCAQLSPVSGPMRGRCRSWAHGDELSRNRQGPLLAGFCISEVEISSGGNSVRMHGGQRCKRRGSKEVSGGADIEVSGGSRGRRGWDLLPGTSCLGPPAWDLLPGTSCLGPPAWDLLPGTSCLLGPPAWDLLPGTSCLGPPAWDLPPGTSYLGPPAWDLLPGVHSVPITVTYHTVLSQDGETVRPPVPFVVAIIIALHHVCLRAT